MSTRYQAPPPQFRAALRRARSIPLSRWIAQQSGGYAGRPRGTFIPSEMEMGVTADFVAYEEREPRITPTGILDSRGMMLVRVTVPIMEELGFYKSRHHEQEPDEVETILPEDMLAVSDCGLGVGRVFPEEVEGGEPTPEQLQEIVQAVLEQADGDREMARKMLADLGFDVSFKDEVASS